VFPGKRLGKPFSSLPKVWKRALRSTELSNLTPHGLRHAYASVASDLGYAEPTIAALIGHATRTMTSRYIHHLDQALIAAADAVTARIAKAMEGIDVNSIQLSRRDSAA
jgi:integrase